MTSTTEQHLAGESGETMSQAPSASALERSSMYTPPTEQQARENAIYAIASYLCVKAGGDPHTLIWEGGPVPEPWGDAYLKYEEDATAILDGDGLSVKLDDETFAELHLMNGDAWLDEGHRELVVDTMLNYAIPEYRRKVADGLFAEHIAAAQTSS